MDLGRILSPGTAMGIVQSGLKLEAPAVFIPFGIDRHYLLELFAGASAPTKVADGHYVAECDPFGGIWCRIGFHFAAEKPPLLHRFTLSRVADYWGSHTLRQSYDEFQRYFERDFGTPATASGPAGFASHQWELGGVQVRHFVQENPPLAEHAEIRLLANF